MACAVAACATLHQSAVLDRFPSQEPAMRHAFSIWDQKATRTGCVLQIRLQTDGLGTIASNVLRRVAVGCVSMPMKRDLSPVVM